MPLASIISALGMWLAGQTTYAAARLPFILIAALVVPVTAALSYSFSKKRDVAIISALLAIFSVYSASFVGVTDNFSLFMLFGGLYFICATKLLEDPSHQRYWLFLGLLSGLFSLSRSDGLLWLAVTFLFTLFRAPKDSFSRIVKYVSINSLIALLGFLVIMALWYARNLNTFGTIMAPGGSRALWLQNYDETFIYPPEKLNMETFLATGWNEILKDRMWALGNNLQSGFAAHGGIILFPFIVAGVIYFRSDERVKLAGTAWLILFFVMSFIFPFAGARGAFFHAGAALQPMWWTLAPLGLDEILLRLRNRNWGDNKTVVIFRSALVMITIILTVFVVNMRLFTLGWGEGEDVYPAVEQFLLEKGIKSNDVVIVLNAPGYYVSTERSAISVPYGGKDAILAVSKQFGANYLVLEEQGTLPPLRGLIDDPQGHKNFMFLGKVNGIYVFKITE
jgi:4-amino-4-deoxy-L-arabinose transferase-like glycosyltransferase